MVLGLFISNLIVSKAHFLLQQTILLRGRRLSWDFSSPIFYI